LFNGQKNKTSALPPEAASARIAPKICQGQLQTIDSEIPKFHPNPFTFGGVVAERANIVQTHHKVFAILGEASASSPSKHVFCLYSKICFTRPRTITRESLKSEKQVWAVGSHIGPKVLVDDNLLENV